MPQEPSGIIFKNTEDLEQGGSRAKFVEEQHENRGARARATAEATRATEATGAKTRDNSSSDDWADLDDMNGPSEEEGQQEHITIGPPKSTLVSQSSESYRRREPYQVVDLDVSIVSSSGGARSQPSLAPELPDPVFSTMGEDAAGLKVDTSPREETRIVAEDERDVESHNEFEDPSPSQIRPPPGPQQPGAKMIPPTRVQTTKPKGYPQDAGPEYKDQVQHVGPEVQRQRKDQAVNQTFGNAAENLLIEGGPHFKDQARPAHSPAPHTPHQQTTGEDVQHTDTHADTTAPIIPDAVLVQSRLDPYQGALVAHAAPVDEARARRQKRIYIGIVIVLVAAVVTSVAVAVTLTQSSQRSEGDQVTVQAPQPVSNTDTPTPQPVARTPNFITALQAREETYSTLLRLLDAADLTNTFAGLTNVTFLAPSNEAIPAETETFLLEAGNEDILQSVLLYHAIDQLFNFGMQANPNILLVSTLQGENIVVGLVDSVISFNQGSVASLQVFLIFTPEIIAYEIDRILVPPTLSTVVPRI